MKYCETLKVNKDLANVIKKVLTISPKCESECFSEDEKISEIVTFENGYEASIECCGVQYLDGEDESNLAWTQGVLYDENGGEVIFTEPSDDFFGEWDFEDDNGNTYLVNVVIGE